MEKLSALVFVIDSCFVQACLFIKIKAFSKRARVHYHARMALSIVVRTLLRRKIFYEQFSEPVHIIVQFVLRIVDI